MYMYPIFPDETLLVIEYLTDHPYLVNFGPLTIAGDLKGYLAPNRWITVQVTGGTKLNKVRVAAPRVDINVYAETKPMAKRIALAAVAAMESMKNYVNDDAVVTDTDVSLPADLTDPVNSNPRYVFDATINIRPN
jgi:predicted DNA-binding ArsR family transcriptional regulator